MTKAKQGGSPSETEKARGLGTPAARAVLGASGAVAGGK